MVVSPKSSRKRSRACTLALALTAATPALAIPTPPREALVPNQNVRVLLGVHARATVSGYDLALNGESLPGTSVFNLRCGTEPESQAAYVEYGAGRRAIGKLEIRSPTGFLSLNDKTYRQSLTITPDGNACSIVNTVDLDKYLAGVIAKEMAPGWPLEALKAQAVASRSYALYQIAANQNKTYDLENGTQDQVYDGANGENPKTVQAVEATRGLVLTYAQSALKAYFHANCGGITEVPDQVWGGEVKAFRAVVCPYHRKPRDRTQWSAVLTKPQIEKALRHISGLLPKSFRRIASLEAGAPDASRRLSDVAISDDLGNNVLINANTFRNALGNTKLKSTAFHIHKSVDGFRVDGEGNGHGVGLCQVGARAMAEEGKSYRQILAFYYPLAKIQPHLLR